MEYPAEEKWLGAGEALSGTTEDGSESDLLLSMVWAELIA
jgi:hypothetical protein